MPTRPFIARCPSETQAASRVALDGSGRVRRIALFTSLATSRQLLENPYADRIEGDVLTYTGSGKAGDQLLSGPNARLLQQLEGGFPVYGFVQVANRRNATHGIKRWCFLGLLDLLRSYSEPQLDAHGQRRSAWVFELLVHGRPATVLVSEDRQAADAARSAHGDGLRPLDREIAPSTRPTSDANDELTREDLEPVRRQLLAMDPRRFELFLKDLLTLSGFSQVEVTRFSQDGGIDVNARPGPRAWPIRQVLVQLQAKRWLHTVGRKEVAELRGSLQAHAAGCIVTTSHFSRAALLEAKEPGKIPIEVIDGQELAAWTREVGYPLG